ncbi:MAG: tetratricopeptide repeat protein, partial [Gammaproteobacteria bacterium]|nr:tetratricopeptide repeat protein [Gammaproteobacteria bacterium]
LYNDVLGDAYAALGDYTKAVEAYGRAMADPSSNNVIDRAFIQMKLADLPQAVVTTAEGGENE